MFQFIYKEDRKTGDKYKNYSLTQGDRFTLTVTPKNGDNSMISRILFKLGFGECVREKIYEQEFVLDDDGIWYCVVPSEVTSKWEPTCKRDDEPYKYEVEVYFADGEPETVTHEKATFTVYPQIGGGDV